MEKVHLIYIAFLAIGGLGLLSSLIFGEFHGDADFGHEFSADGHDAGDADSPKIFSLRVIFAFLMAFGIGGGAMFLAEKGLGGQLIVGFLSGAATGAITYYLMKLLYSFQGNSNLDSETFIGKNAQVTVETTNSGSSQVKVDSGGGDQLFMAKEKNSAPLKLNEIVKVVGRLGTVLIVEKL